MSSPEVLVQRRRRAARHSWWRGGLEAGVWCAAATGVAFAIAAGAVPFEASSEGVRSLARCVGIVSAVLMMSQVLLASRAPWIEHAVGHDHAIATHTRLGKFAILGMAVHLSLILGYLAAASGLGVIEVWKELAKGSGALLASTLAIFTFVVILATSLWAGVRRWNYESWHTVHRLTYVAVALAVPHQFLEGSTFRGGGVAWVFWFALYGVAVGSFVVYRMARPGWLAMRHRARVSSVRKEDDGSTTVEIEGRRLDKLKARPGQFFLWRFWTRSLIFEKHPYSLSSAPGGNRLRITVKPIGHGSRKLGEVRPGTRVTFEGPLGIFTHAERVGSGLVLVAAGIGVTPIRAMLDEVTPGEACTVIVRVRGVDEAPLLDEVKAVATRVGADLHILAGPRGDSWFPAGISATLLDLAPHVKEADVFVCGPVDWAREVEAEARRSGVPARAIHRERFGW